MTHGYIDLSNGRPDENDVHDALEFLVSMEPYPPPLPYEQYNAAIAPYETQIARACLRLSACTSTQFRQPPIIPAFKNIGKNYADFSL